MIYIYVSLVNMGKIFCYFMNRHIKKVSEEYKVFGEEQDGFREDRSWEDNIYIIRETSISGFPRY